MTTHAAQVSWHGGKDDLRAHTVRAGGQTIGGSCSPEWGGDDAKADPEALFVGALSACHMLWFLDLARRERLRVTSYEDSAEGEMDGTRFTHGHAAAAGGVRVRRRRGDAHEPSRAAHERCFIANTVNCPVEVEAA